MRYLILFLALICTPAEAARHHCMGVRAGFTISVECYPTRAAFEETKDRLLSLDGVVEPLAAKAREIVSACGSKVSGGVHSHSKYVARTRRVSLHRIGRAVDASGNPDCIREHLRDWPGGVSTDYNRVGHYHFSYDPGGREWGLRFRHGGGHKKRGHRHKRR